MTKEEKLKLFVNELGYIKNPVLKKFAEEIIGNADDYFFIVPASSSGKYHPQFSLGDGGLMRHTRCVAYFAKANAESYDFSDDDSDLLVISALAHDIKKQGNNTSVGGHTVREHPLLAADYVREIASKFTEGAISKEQIEKICGAVSCHMGKWEHHAQFLRRGCEPYPMPKDDFEKALQLADYIASRKAILSFEFTPTETVQLPVLTEAPKVDPETMTLEELENYVVTFGKHSGKTFKEIKPTGYLDWMCKQEDFNKKDTQILAKKYLSLLENKTSKTIIDDDLPF